MWPPCSCNAGRAGRKVGVRTVKKASAEERRHRWPLCVPIAENATKKTKLQWFDSDRVYMRNCVTVMDEATAETKDNGLWNLVIGIEPIKMAWNLDDWSPLKTVPRLVPAYLRDVCSRHLQVDNILNDLANFIARNGGHFDVKKVEEVLWVAEGIDCERRHRRPRRKAITTTMG